MILAIPGYLDKELWEQFVQMRKAMGKTRPFTDYAQRLIISELDKLKRAGHDPNASLRQSIIHGYSGVFEPRGKLAAPNDSVRSTEELFQSWQQTPEQREASERARKEAMRRRTH